jgi:hypothetical protein
MERLKLDQLREVERIKLEYEACLKDLKKIHEQEK